MQRRVGRITPISARPGARLGASAALRRASARSARRGSRTTRRSAVADFGDRARALAALSDHHRERLGLARLARPQPRDRRLVARVADQMKAADALHRDDPAGRDASAIVSIGDVDARPAARAGDRLGVEAAVGGIAIVARAILAHRERRHRGLRAVIGQRARQRVARAAMGAVDERIADRTGSRDQTDSSRQSSQTAASAPMRVRAAPVAGRVDLETASPLRRAFVDLDRVDARQRRRLAPQRLDRKSAAPRPRPRSARLRRRCARNPRARAAARAHRRTAESRRPARRRAPAIANA